MVNERVQVVMGSRGMGVAAQKLFRVSGLGSIRCVSAIWGK